MGIREDPLPPTLGKILKYSRIFFEGVPESVSYAFNPLLLTARNVFDSTGDALRLEVEVVDPIVENMGMEVHPFISRNELNQLD